MHFKIMSVARLENIFILFYLYIYPSDLQESNEDANT